MEQENEAFRVKFGGREFVKSVDGRLTFRVPAHVVQLHGFNNCGWFGWDPLNFRWVSCPYGLPFAYQENLREALAFIDWATHTSSRGTIDWLKAYPQGSSLGLLSLWDRMELAQLLEYSNPKRLTTLLHQFSHSLPR